MSAFTTINGKQVALPGATTNSAPAAAASTSKTHQAECGDVGATGEHGAIGSNAKESQAK